MLDVRKMKTDEKYIRRCIELSSKSLAAGDAPFGSLITMNDEILVECLNNSKGNVNEHAEIIALNETSKKLGTSNLCDCTLYTNCEPCPMCSFMIREHKIQKVVFSLASPYMGGFSKWGILQDEDLERFSPYFGKPPEIIPYVLESEAKKVFDKTNLWMFGRRANT